MTQAATPLKPATLVLEARRMAFLPALFSPALMLIVTIRRRPRLCGFDDQSALPVPGKEFWQA